MRKNTHKLLSHSLKTKTSEYLILFFMQSKLLQVKLHTWHIWDMTHINCNCANLHQPSGYNRPGNHEVNRVQLIVDQPLTNTFEWQLWSALRLVRLGSDAMRVRPHPPCRPIGSVEEYEVGGARVFPSTPARLAPYINPVQLTVSWGNSEFPSRRVASRARHDLISSDLIRSS